MVPGLMVALFAAASLAAAPAGKHPREGEAQRQGARASEGGASQGHRRRPRALSEGAGRERAEARAGARRLAEAAVSRLLSMAGRPAPPRSGDGARGEPCRRVRSERRAGVGGPGRGASGRERAAAGRAREPAEGRGGDDRHAGLGCGTARRHPDAGGVRRLRRGTRGRPPSSTFRTTPPAPSRRASIRTATGRTSPASWWAAAATPSRDAWPASPPRRASSPSVSWTRRAAGGRRTSWPACSGSSTTRTSWASVS